MQLIRPYVPVSFLEISPVSIIRTAIDTARQFPYPVQIQGAPGYGKTTALYHLSKEDGATYCHVGAGMKSVPDMYRMLLAAFEIQHDENYTRDLYNRLVGTLRRRLEYDEIDGLPRRLLVVDEVQTLEATAQRELLNIQETCEIALIMSGNGERLAKSRVDRNAWEQINSRLGMRVQLPPLNEQDCIEIGTAFAVEGMDSYRAITAMGTQTSVRELIRVLEQAKVLTVGGSGIHLQHINQAVLAIYGTSDALKRLKPREE